VKGKQRRASSKHALVIAHRAETPTNVPGSTSSAMQYPAATTAAKTSGFSLHYSLHFSSFNVHAVVIPLKPPCLLHLHVIMRPYLGCEERRRDTIISRTTHGFRLTRLPAQSNIALGSIGKHSRESLLASLT
jgi:hypothetical protein